MSVKQLRRRSETADEVAVEATRKLNLDKAESVKAWQRAKGEAYEARQELAQVEAGVPRSNPRNF